MNVLDWHDYDHSIIYETLKSPTQSRASTPRICKTKTSMTDASFVINSTVISGKEDENEDHFGRGEVRIFVLPGSRNRVLHVINGH